MEKTEGKKPLVKTRCRWMDDIIEVDLKDVKDGRVLAKFTLLRIRRNGGLL
jgi:hypothetical protein